MKDKEYIDIAIKIIKELCEKSINDLIEADTPEAVDQGNGLWGFKDEYLHAKRFGLFADDCMKSSGEYNFKIFLEYFALIVEEHRVGKSIYGSKSKENSIVRKLYSDFWNEFSEIPQAQYDTHLMSRIYSVFKDDLFKYEAFSNGVSVSPLLYKLSSNAKNLIFKSYNVYNKNNINGLHIFLNSSLLYANSYKAEEQIKNYNSPSNKIITQTMNDDEKNMWYTQFFEILNKFIETYSANSEDNRNQIKEALIQNLVKTRGFFILLSKFTPSSKCDEVSFFQEEVLKKIIKDFNVFFEESNKIDLENLKTLYTIKKNENIYNISLNKNTKDVYFSEYCIELINSFMFNAEDVKTKNKQKDKEKLPKSTDLPDVSWVRRNKYQDKRSIEVVFASDWTNIDQEKCIADILSEMNSVIISKRGRSVVLYDDMISSDSNNYSIEISKAINRAIRANILGKQLDKNKTINTMRKTRKI